MAVAKFTRTITTTILTAKVVERNTLEGASIKIPLGDYVTNEVKMEKLARKYVEKNLPDHVLVSIMDVEQHTQKYEMDINTFLTYATPVKE